MGDIHGSFDLVLRAMHEARFDPAVDRLFSVGDLIDRGTASHRCIKFLAQPYVHAVRGNHESMLIELYAQGEPETGVLHALAQRNGFGWWLLTPVAVRKQVLRAIRELPLAIEVETTRGLVGFVHADVPSGLSWPEFVVQLEAGDPATINTALWGRKRIQSGNHAGVPEIGRVFVGHTPHWGNLRRYGNVYAIDTGAVFGETGLRDSGRLTVANLVMGTAPLASDAGPVGLVDLRDDGATPALPFGQYASAD